MFLEYLKPIPVAILYSWFAPCWNENIMKLNMRFILELLMTTGLMAMIMSGVMLSYHFGFLTPEMMGRWVKVYPLAWMVAIPGIFISRTIVRSILGLFFKN